VIWVGTSGWQYKDWRGVLYPEKLPQRVWLEHYAERFATVELNNAFYRLPALETFKGWRERTPDGFVMAVKASRYLTHVRRLRDPAQPVATLMERAAGLGDRLGPILLQLPPTLPADAGALSATLSAFPPGQRVAVEPRHETWWSDEIRAVLERHNAALCWADRLGPITPPWRTADFGYVRFHAGSEDLWPRYTRDTLAAWIGRIADAFDADTDVYAYFNNDPDGVAVSDARTLASLATGVGLPTSRVPETLIRSWDGDG